MAGTTKLATLIGDLVGSKRAGDRSALQKTLVAALRSVNRSLPTLQPLEPTVGDEFQGAFADVATAARASLLLRLELLARDEADSRYGLGYGDVTVFASSRSPRSQDGPGWWSARAAIERSQALAEMPRMAFSRTRFESRDDGQDIRPEEVAAVNAFLICRDATVDRMSPRGRRLLLGQLLGKSQSHMAKQEGITQSAVSQGLASSGASAIEAAQNELEGGDLWPR